MKRFGFGYGTLPGHAERGEERFSVEWYREDGYVYYDVFAFSCPKHPLAWFGCPFARALQRRFARDSRRVCSSQRTRRAGARLSPKLLDCPPR